MSRIVAKTVKPVVVEEQQDFRGLGIVKTAIGEPPKFKTSAGKFRRVMARANHEVANLAGHIIEAMRHGNAVNCRAEIMVIDFDLLLGVEFAIPIKIAD